MEKRNLFLEGAANDKTAALHFSLLSLSLSAPFLAVAFVGFAVLLLTDSAQPTDLSNMCKHNPKAQVRHTRH